jgi:hypothetical protein
MFPQLELKNVPHVEDLVISALSARDLVRVKLVNKSWATKISQWLRKRISSGRITHHMQAAWSTSIINTTYLSLSHTLTRLEQCTNTGRVRILDRQCQLIRYSADFVQAVNCHNLNDMQVGLSNSVWMKQVGKLVLVFQSEINALPYLGCIYLLECNNGNHQLRYQSAIDFSIDLPNAVAFNGKFFVAVGTGDRNFIWEFVTNDKEEKTLKKWSQENTMECLSGTRSRLVAADESSSNFVIFQHGYEQAKEIHILNGQDLSGEHILQRDYFCSCSLRSLMLKGRLTYRHPYVAMFCPCSSHTIWNVELKKVIARLNPTIIRMTSDMVITKDNMLIYVDVVYDLFFMKHTTNVYSVILRPNEATLPKRIMHLPDVGFQFLQVFGSRIILYSNKKSLYCQFDHTIAVGDVWNEDSVPKTVQLE